MTKTASYKKLTPLQSGSTWWMMICLPLLLLALWGCRGQKSALGSMQIHQAIYEGVEGYGITDESSLKDGFRFNFLTEKGRQSQFSIANPGGSYILHNRLEEGSRYVMMVSGTSSRIEDLVRLTPDAKGTVTKVSGSEIEIDGRSYKLSEDVEYYDIDCQAGGAMASRIPKVEEGDQVSLYGSPANFVDRGFIAVPYTSPITPTPGSRTIKNLIKSALNACGTTMYIYGGAWNWQDDGSSPQSTTIGVPESWKTFFQMHKEPFIYKEERNPSRSFYPHHGYNEYYYAGADCSGFISWAVYNVMNTKSGGEGYVTASSRLARSLAQEHGLGTFSRDISRDDFLPGDIFSMKGHVWMCLGKAKDGSLVIIHSTVDGSLGSGIQISALSDSQDCEAYRLAQTHMQQYYPEWSTRFNAVCRDIDQYTAMESEDCGRFRWTISEDGLEDPEGYLSMTAEEILSDLYK